MALAFAHVPTMLAMIILSSLTTAGGMAVVGAERRHDGVQWWALGLLFNAVAHLLFALRGTIPDIFSIVLSNTLLMGVYLSLLAAVLQFQGRRLPRTAAVALPLLMAGCMALLADSYAARVVVAGLLLSAMNLWLLSCLITRWKTMGGRGAWLVVGALGFQTLVFALRIGLVGISSWVGAELMQSSAVQTLTFMSTFAVVLVASMGFVFMARDRADEDNRRLAAVDSLTGVANRRAVIAALDRDVARSIRTHEPMALMMVDIDHFKNVNDRYGHLAVLYALAACSMFLSAWLSAPALQLMALSLVAFCLFSTTALFWTLPGRFFTGASAAAAIALINSVGNLGGYIGPFGIGALKEYTGNLASGLYFLTAVLCFGLLLTWVVYQRLERRHAQQQVSMGNA